MCSLTWALQSLRFTACEAAVTLGLFLSWFALLKQSRPPDCTDFLSLQHVWQSYVKTVGKRIWIGPSRWEAVPWTEGLFPLSGNRVVTRVGRQRNCIQVCQRAERGAVFSLLIGWVFPPSQIVLDKFSWLCTACFKKLMLSVSRFEVERKEVVLSGQLIWLESNYPL